MLDALRNLPQDQFQDIAQTLGTIAAILFAALIEFRRRTRATAQPAGGANVEVAGALIDGKQAQAIVAAVIANTAAIERSSEATSRVVESMDEIRRDMADLTREIVRHSR